MFSPKNREKIRWRWIFSLLTKMPLQVAFMGGGPLPFILFFLVWAGHLFSFFFFFFLLLGSNVKVASLFSFFLFHFPFDFLGPEHDYWFFFTRCDFFGILFLFIFNKFGWLFYFLWLFVTFFVLIRHHSLTRVYE